WPQVRAATPAASASAGDRAQIAALEQRWLTAAHGGDRHALKNILAPDFIDVDVNGQVRTRADHVRTRPRRPARPKKSRNWTCACSATPPSPQASTPCTRRRK